MMRSHTVHSATVKRAPAQKQVIIITPMSYQTVIATGNSIATLGLYWGKSSLSHPLLLVLIFWDFFVPS